MRLIDACFDDVQAPMAGQVNLSRPVNEWRQLVWPQIDVCRLQRLALDEWHCMVNTWPNLMYLSKTLLHSCMYTEMRLQES